jgi:hypothetical protein
MDIDFTALASRVAARAEVLGCVILSKDGLVMGAFPPGGERDVTPAWLRFASVGNPERGFVEFPGELWAYVRQGPYAAFAVGAPGTRAGILLDYLEQALLAAEDSRDQRAAVRAPETVDLNREHFGSIRPAEHPAQPVTASWGQPVQDTSVQQATSAPEQPAPWPQQPSPALEAFPAVVTDAVPATVHAEPEWRMPGDLPRSADPVPSEFEARPETQPEALQPFPFAPPIEAQREEPSDSSEAATNPEDVDRVALAREFAQLLQDGPFGVEEGR